MSARVIQVIEYSFARGCGGGPNQSCREQHVHEICRQVIQYLDFDGNVLAEYDSVPVEKRRLELQ